MSEDPIRFLFDAPESALLEYKREAGGARGSLVDIRLQDETEYRWKGRVEFLDNTLDRASGTIRARAVVPNADRSLTPGLFARVQLAGGNRKSALLIDEKAVLTDQDRKYVHVLGPNNVAVRKDVVLGRKAGELRVVESGLEPGEAVIVHGVQKVFFAGMPVSPQQIVMGEAAPDALRMAANAASSADAS